MEYRYKVLFLLSNPLVGGTETFTFSVVSGLHTLSIDARIGNLWAGSKLAKLAEDVGIPYFEFNSAGRVIRLRGIWELVKLLRGEKFDIVYGFGLRVSLLMRLIYFLACRPILIVGIRNVDTWRRWYHIWPDRATEGLIRSFVCNSQKLVDIRRSIWRTNPKRLCVIVNGIDVEYFSPDAKVWPCRDELGLPGGGLLITVANIRHTKGHSFYLDALVRAIEIGLPKDVKCLWLGEGPLKKDLVQKAKRLGVADRIIWGGNAMDVRPYLANADAFVLSSKEEGMPRALMEAMSMSIPCVATNVGGIPEVIEQDVSGLMSDFGDIEKFADNIIRLLACGDLRKKMGASARKRIVEHFNIEVVARKYLKLFELVCSGQRDGREIQKILSFCK